VFNFLHGLLTPLNFPTLRSHPPDFPTPFFPTTVLPVRAHILDTKSPNSRPTPTTPFTLLFVSGTFLWVAPPFSLRTSSAGLVFLSFGMTGTSGEERPPSESVSFAHPFLFFACLSRLRPANDTFPFCRRPCTRDFSLSFRPSWPLLISFPGVVCSFSCFLF